VIGRKAGTDTSPIRSRVNDVGTPVTSDLKLLVAITAALSPHPVNAERQRYCAMLAGPHRVVTDTW
jgi:hypothetical protein